MQKLKVCEKLSFLTSGVFILLTKTAGGCGAVQSQADNVTKAAFSSDVLQ
jgi:hypothetical protein